MALTITSICQWLLNPPLQPTLSPSPHSKLYTYILTWSGLSGCFTSTSNSTYPKQAIFLPCFADLLLVTCLNWLFFISCLGDRTNIHSCLPSSSVRNRSGTLGLPCFPHPVASICQFYLLNTCGTVNAFLQVSQFLPHTHLKLTTIHLHNTLLSATLVREKPDCVP